MNNSSNMLLKRNEIESNKLVAKINLVISLIYTCVLILNAIGIFDCKMHIMLIAYFSSLIFTLLPSYLVYVKKYEYTWLKYVLIACSLIVLFISTFNLSYHTLVAYLYPMIISTLYYSKRLNRVVMVLTVILTSVAQVMAQLLVTVHDDEFKNMEQLIFWGLLPRAMLVIGLSEILTMFAERIYSILSELMDVNEQKTILERSKLITEKSKEVSDELTVSVLDLTKTSDIVSNSNVEIVKETENILKGATDNKNNIDIANDKIIEVYDKIEDLNYKSDEVAMLSENVKDNIEENQFKINKTTEGMEKIHSNVYECKDIITELADRSNEIISIINIISEIASQTNILSLNASIEAARAGEHGKGFAVVAEEIQVLANQTRISVEDIATIINEVLQYTNKAEDAMQRSVSLTREGLKSINEIKIASDNITTSNVEMAEKINNIDDITKIIRDNSKEIATYMNKVKNVVEDNLINIEKISYVTKESSEGAKVLIEIVDNINKMSKKLNEVISE